MRCAEFRDALFEERGTAARAARLMHAWRCRPCREEEVGAHELRRAVAGLVRHEPSPALRERLTGVPGGSVERAQRTAGRRITRLAGWAVAAAVALAAAVLVLLSTGRSDRLLAQALEGLERAQSLHFVVREAEGENGKRTEFWIIDERHFRQEETEAGALREVVVQDGDTAWVDHPVGNRVEVTRGTIGSKLHDFGQMACYPEIIVPYMLQEAPGQGVLTTREEGTTADGRSVVRFVYGPRQGTPSTRIVIVVETAAKRVAGVQAEQLIDGEWQRMCWFEDLEYDTPIAPERLRFAPPPGARIVERAWWVDRKDASLGEVVSGTGWRVRLLSLDVRDSGDVIASLRVTGPPRGIPTPSTDYSPLGRLLDETGRPYALLPSMGVEPDGTLRGHLRRDEQGALCGISDVYWTLGFTPVEPLGRQERPTRLTLELPPLPGETGPAAFEDVTAQELPPGDPFERVLQGAPLPGRPEEEEARDRLEAVERYRQQYGSG